MNDGDGDGNGNGGVKTLDLRVTVDEANLILEGLGEMPFRRVYALVARLQRQAGRQLGEPALLPPPPAGDGEGIGDAT